MLSISRILTDGAFVSFAAVLIMIGAAAGNPRIFLNDYPKPIQAQVAPRNDSERKLGLLAGIPLLLVLFGGPLLSTYLLAARSTDVVPFGLLFIHAAGVAYVFNLIDWLIIDWLIFCTITPKYIVIPGSEGNPAYKDYGFHFRGFLIGTVFSAFVGLLVASIVWLSAGLT